MLEGLRMHRVNFHVVTSEVPEFSLVLAKTGSFAPDQGNTDYQKD